MLDQPPYDGAWMKDLREDQTSVRQSHGGYPMPHQYGVRKEDQRENPPPANLMHTYHLSLPTHRPDNCCHLQIQSCLLHLPKMLNFYKYQS